MRMSDNLPKQGLQLQSTLGTDGTLTVRLAEVDIPQPGPGEVLIRVEAAPINPSDLMTMIGAFESGMTTCVRKRRCPAPSIWAAS